MVTQTKVRRWKETFKLKGTNTAQLNAQTYIVVQDITNAEKDSNLPHNEFTVSNLDTTSDLYLFLDDASNFAAPDFVLRPGQTMSTDAEDGLSFSTLFIYNADAANNIAANKIKYRVSTVREVL